MPEARIPSGGVERRSEELSATAAQRPALDDPLYLDVPLEHRIQLPILGIPVRFATNDRAILDVVLRVFGHWRGMDGDCSPSQGVDITLVLHDGEEGPSDEAKVTFRAPDPLRWFVHTPGSVGFADVERRSGVAYITRALLDDQARFRVSILEFLVLTIVTIEDRTPVHAALIGMGDAALVVAGRAGAGKSTLSYAAAKAGLNVLSDDSTFVELVRRRVWGTGPSVSLLGDTASCFPELASRPMTLFPTGKRKMVLAPDAATNKRYWASRVGVCVLSRSPGPVRLTPISPAEVCAALPHHPTRVARRFGVRLEQAVSWLSARGGWHLSLSADARQAIPCVKELLQEIEATRG